jgi:hypothetical protein
VRCPKSWYLSSFNAISWLLSYVHLWSRDIASPKLWTIGCLQGKQAYQGSYVWGRVKLRTLQGHVLANSRIEDTEEKGLEIRYEHAKSIQQNVRFECQTISENIQKLKQEEFKDFQALLYKFKDIQGPEYLFSSFVRTLTYMDNLPEHEMDHWRY